MDLSGFPRSDVYSGLGDLAVGRRIEQFSERFLGENRRALRYYRRAWVADPLHQWSRRWEYPFVVSRLERCRGFGGRALDAGSGLTFLPFQIAAERLAGSVDCVDADPALGAGYRAIGSRYGGVRHQVADLRQLPYPDGVFDIAWSVSVLEHVAKPRLALDELLRVIRPGGRLLLTFDIDLDTEQDPFDLLRACADLRRRGHSVEGVSSDGPSLPDNVITTRSVDVERSSLPWRLPGPAYQVSCWLTGHGWPQWPPHLTFVCVEVTVGAGR